MVVDDDDAGKDNKIQKEDASLFYGSEPSDSDIDCDEEVSSLVDIHNPLLYAGAGEDARAGAGMGARPVPSFDMDMDHIYMRQSTTAEDSSTSDMCTSELCMEEGGEGGGEGEDEINHDRSIKYKKLSYNDVRNQVNKSYEQDIVHRYSSALDILASYIKGQKIIYMETRSYTVFFLNLLMLPALFISGLLTVLQHPYNTHPYMLSALSAIVTFLLAIINYSKLDGAAEAHKINGSWGVYANSGDEGLGDALNRATRAGEVAEARRVASQLSAALCGVAGELRAWVSQSKFGNKA